MLIPLSKTMLLREKNRHLLNVTHALIFETHVSSDFWGEWIMTATHLINQTSSRILAQKSPLEKLSMLYPHLPSLLSLPLKVFGCVAYVHVHKNHQTKVDPRAVICIFIGHSNNQKGYRFYRPTSRKFFLYRCLVQ